MCGISTIVVLPRPAVNENGGSSSLDDRGKPESKTSTRQGLHDEMQESLNTIKHRGPDSSGVWISENERIGMASYDSKIASKAGRNVTDASDGTQCLASVVCRSTT